MPLKSAVVFDPALTFFSHFFAKSFGGAFAIQESSPSVIEAMKFWAFVFACAMGFATGAQSRGDASGQYRAPQLKDNYVIILDLHPNVYIH